MIGMLLNVAHGQVKANITLAPYNITMVSKQPNRQQLFKKQDLPCAYKIIAVMVE